MIRGWGVQLAQLVDDIRRGGVQATLKEEEAAFRSWPAERRARARRTVAAEAAAGVVVSGEGTWVADEVADEELWRGASDNKGGGLERLSLKRGGNDDARRPEAVAELQEWQAERGQYPSAETDWR